MKLSFRSILLFTFCVGLIVSGCEWKLGSKKNHSNAKDPHHPDVVIIGSELEGMYLARAAADEGLSVVILDPREQPGGQLIQGQMLFLDEPTNDEGKTLLQGRVKQLFDRYKNGEIRKISEFEAYYNNLIQGIPLESGITITGITADGTKNLKMKSIAYRTKSGEEKTISASYWVENTDFAALTSRLNKQRIPGIETVFGATKDQTKETSKDYMASTYIMKFQNVDWSKFQHEVNQLSIEKRTALFGSESNVTDSFTWGFGNVGRSYQPIHKDLFLRGLNIVNQRDGDALINALLVFQVDPSNNERVQEAVRFGKEETVHVLEHLRKQLPGWEKAEINGFPNYLYIRDYDRYETQYVLQATDLLSGKMFWDNVSIGGYPIDLQGTQNHPWGIRIGTPDQYGMPLRSFLLKDYDNVIVAGKNVGASAVAYGSARIQANTSLAGEVIGIILGQLHGKKELSALTEQEMKQLRNVIKSKYGISLESKANNKIAAYTKVQLIQINEGKIEVK